MMRNPIAEVCAELARYRVFIRVDDILDHYSEAAIAAMDTELWRFLENIQASDILMIEAKRKKSE